jgi:hypothetical protein
VSCNRSTGTWQRLCQRVLRDSRSWLLGALGTILILVGALVTDDKLSVALVVPGIGIAVLALLLPVVTEADVGPGGFKLKTQTAQRDATFTPFLSEELAEFTDFAALLSGDADAAPALVNRALAKTYAIWDEIPRAERQLYAYCFLVAAIEGSTRLGLVANGRGQKRQPRAESIPSDTTALFSLPFQSRAAVVLRRHALLDERDIAHILDQPVEVTHEIIHGAEALLQKLLASAP